MKVFDCFTFFNEIDLLKFRLEFLYDHVEKFVICEADVTFSGQAKPFNFLERQSEFAPWHEKIQYIQYRPDVSGLSFTRPTQWDLTHDAWKVEFGQRDHLYSAVADLGDDCMVIVTDADEIWNPSFLAKVQSQPSMKAGRLEMLMHYFFMNCRGVGPANSHWDHSYFVAPSLLRANASLGLSTIRRSARLPTVDDAGWHFSYLGGPQEIIRKIEAFSHQELNTEDIKEVRRIEHCIDHGLDPFGRPDHRWEFVPIDSCPPELAGLMGANPQFIKRLPELESPSTRQGAVAP